MLGRDEVLGRRTRRSATAAPKPAPSLRGAAAAGVFLSRWRPRRTSVCTPTSTTRSSSARARVRTAARSDARGRWRSVARGVVSTADGSTLAKIGRTTALAAVKLELVTPELDAPDEGGLDVTVELPPMCSAAARPGRPSEEAAYCSRRVADALRDAKVVDPKRLCVDEGRFA